MAFLAPLAMAATVAGTALSTVGALTQGEAAQDAANFEARQLERRANESRAAGQKQMFEQQKRTELMQSKLRSSAAASGGDTTDATVLRLGGDIAERGEYLALSEMAAGENRAIGFEDQAAASRYKGKVAKTGSYFKAAGTALDGIGSFATQYNKFYG